MQDEVNTKVVAIMIKGGKISAEVLKKALDKFVQEIEKAQKQMQQPKTYRGKQSIKHLMSQNAAISNIEVTDGNIKSFERKALIPTKDGCNLVCVLPERITSPKMTAEWENTLMEIERGNADADAFLSGIVRMTGDLVKAYPFLSDAEAQRFGTGKEEIGKCPRCGSPVYVGKGNFYCSNKECSFCLWEDNKFFSSKKKKLTKRIAKELLDKGWCRVTGLYTPKKPQLYDAVIRLDDSGGKYVSFKMEFDR